MSYFCPYTFTSDGHWVAWAIMSGASRNIHAQVPSGGTRWCLMGKRCTRVAHYISVSLSKKMSACPKVAVPFCIPTRVCESSTSPQLPDFRKLMAKRFP